MYLYILALHEITVNELCCLFYTVCTVSSTASEYGTTAVAAVSKVQETFICASVLPTLHTELLDNNDQIQQWPTLNRVRLQLNSLPV